MLKKFIDLQNLCPFPKWSEEQHSPRQSPCEITKRRPNLKDLLLFHFIFVPLPHFAAKWAVYAPKSQVVPTSKNLDLGTKDCNTGSLGGWPAQNMLY